MKNNSKKIQLIYIIYWCLLAYTIAALIFWFISLNKQNEQMAKFKKAQLQEQNVDFTTSYNNIDTERKRKTAQYIGEGVTFLLMIMAGAIFIFRSVRRQLKQSQLQQNFMMAITHELKTPIAVAQLNLETLQKRKLDVPQQQKLIQNTLQETVRLNALCNNMLIASQIDAGGYRMTKDELDMSEIVRSCYLDFHNRFPLRVISADIDPDIFVTGDRLLLEMAVNNLLDNAIKYSPKPGKVALSLKQNRDAILKIADEGIGIADADKKKVFQKFYRAGNIATKTAKGTGLGLYLTYRIVKAHSGSIQIEDNQPSGTVFSITLKSA